MHSGFFESLSWRTLFDSIGCRIDSAVLPYRTRCFSCGQDFLTLYSDPPAHWGYCVACGRHGNIIELVAAAWKTDVVEAASRIISEGFAAPASDFAELAELLRSQVARQDAITRLWDAASTWLTTDISADAVDICRAVGIGRYIHRADLPEFTTGLIGGLPAEQLFDFLRNRPRYKGRRRSKTAVSPTRLFNGGGWTDLLLIPHYWRPGQLAGLYCIGREAAPEDRVYLPLQRRKGLNDPGFSLLPALLQPKVGRVKMLCLLDDPVLALRAQLKHIHSTGLPAPILGMLPESGSGCLSGLPQAGICVITTTDSPGAYRLAAEAEAVICRVGADIPDFAESPFMLRNWLDRAIASANSWPYQLVAAIRDSGQTYQGSGLLSSVRLNPAQLARFNTICPATLLPAAQASAGAAPAGKKIEFDGQIISISPTGFFTKSGACIIDTPVEIDQLICRNGEPTHVRGTIAADPGLKFCFTAKDAENDLFGCVERFMLSHSRIVHYLPRWRGRAYRLALKASAPRVVSGSYRVGWCAEESTLKLPSFGITARGLLITDPAVLPVGEHLPANPLCQPHISLELLQAYSAAGSAVVSNWLAALCVIDSVIADICGSACPPIPVMVTGAGAKMCASALETLGVLGFELPSSNNWRQRFNKIVRKHNWPTMVGLSDQAGDAWPGRLLTADLAGRYIAISRRPELGSLAGIVGKHHVIAAPNADSGQPAGTVPHPGHLVTGFLQHFLQQGARLNAVSPFRLYSVLSAVAAWWHSLGGELAGLQAAECAITPAGDDRGGHLLDLLHVMRRRFVLRTEYSRQHTKVTWSAFVGALGRLKLPTIPQEAVDEAMSLCGQAIKATGSEDKRAWTFAQGAKNVRHDPEAVFDRSE